MRKLKQDTSSLKDQQGTIHNYSIDIVRMLLAYEVILCHFWNSSNNLCSSVINNLCGCAAPLFFLLSFYLSAKYIVENDSAKLQKRIVRLYAPFLFWGVVAWIFYVVIHYTKEPKEKLIMALFWQISVGNGWGVNTPLWYIFVLLLLTESYHFIFHLGKNQE